MSICAVRVSDGGITLAFDSFAMTDGTVQHTYPSGMPKKGMIISGRVAIAGAGDLADLIHLFRYAELNLPLLPTLDSVRDFYCAFRHWIKDEVFDVSLDSTYLLLIEGHAFYLDDDILIHEITEYKAIGAGRAEALVALSLGADPVTAVAKAAQFNAYCDWPIHKISMVKDREGVFHLSDRLAHPDDVISLC